MRAACRLSPLRPGVKQLSLDDAIRLGIENNLALTLAHLNEKSAEAQKLQLANALLPNLSLHGETGLHQLNLRAAGFSPGVLPQFGVPPAEAALFPYIVKVDSTDRPGEPLPGPLHLVRLGRMESSQGERKSRLLRLPNPRAGWWC